MQKVPPKRKDKTVANQGAFCRILISRLKKCENGWSEPKESPNRKARFLKSKDYSALPPFVCVKKSDGPINIVKVLDLLFLDRLQDFDDLPGGELWHKREAPTYWDVRWSNGPFAAKPRTSCWWVRGIQWTLRLTKLHKHARSDQWTASKGGPLQLPVFTCEGPQNPLDLVGKIYISWLKHPNLTQYKKLSWLLYLPRPIFCVTS